MGTYVKKTSEERMSARLSRETANNELLENISEEYLDYTLPELCEELRNIIEEDVMEYQIRVKVLKEKIKDSRTDFEMDE